jgi:subtilisin family serine protease
MRSHLAITAILASLLSAVGPADRIPNDTVLLVRFRPVTTASEQHRLFQSMEATMIGGIPQLDVSIISVPAAHAGAVLNALNRDSSVVYAEPDARAWATLSPNDPGWEQQWGPQKINAPLAWDVTLGSPDVVMAVMDSGIRLDHPDLSSRLWVNPGEVPDNRMDDDGNGKVDDLWGWRFYHDWNGQTYVPAEDNHITDDFGHGTHAAGIAGAEINNSVGVAGIAGGSQLMTVKVLNQYGVGWYSDIAQGIVYAVDNGARIINLSLGGDSPSQMLQDAVNYAYAHGVLAVAAAGNDGEAILYPAACDHVLAVAATDQNDVQPSFSNHGPQVDVAAPGVDIYSTWPWVGGYFTKSGTSMAAPHVAGVAALIWSARPDLTVEQATGIITATAKDVNGATFPGWDEHLGWGRIEAGRAVEAAMAGGALRLTCSHPAVSVGGTATITATTPLSTGIPVTFTARGGILSPTTATLVSGTATTLLTAAPLAGMAVVTGTAGGLTGSLFLPLLPGAMVSATLQPASWVVAPGGVVAMTMTAIDTFGNPPLDGTPITWTARGGTVAPIQSWFEDGVGQATFTAGPVHGPAVITASLKAGLAARTTVNVTVYQHYLPVIVRGDDHQGDDPHATNG